MCNIFIDYYMPLSISTEVLSRDPIIGPKAFAQLRNDIVRGMIAGLILKGASNDLFITYFIHNLFWFLYFFELQMEQFY